MKMIIRLVLSRFATCATSRGVRHAIPWAVQLRIISTPVSVMTVILACITMEQDGTILTRGVLLKRIASFHQVC